MMNSGNQTYPFIANMKNHPEVIAHRGGNGEWPGETIGAYEHSRKLEVDVIEMDIYLTSDQQLVLMHDRSVSKTTDGTREVHEYTLAEIQHLNAGYNWTPDNRTLPYGMKFAELSPELQRKLHVPSLREVFDQFGDMRMIIEMKPAVCSPAAQLWSMLREYPQIIPNVLVASFRDRYLNEFRRLSRGQVATSVSVIELIQLLLGLRGFEKPVRPCLVDAPHRLLRPFLMKKFRRRGYAVHAWTVNKRQDMERMKNLGVDGIITDNPSLLLDVLGRSARAG